MIPKRLTSGAPLVRSLSGKNSISTTLPTIASNPGVSLAGDSALRRVLRSQVGPTTEFFALGGSSRHQKIMKMDNNRNLIKEFALLKQNPKQPKRAVVEPAAPEPADGDTGSILPSSTNVSESAVSQEGDTGPHALSLNAAYSAFSKSVELPRKEYNTEEGTIVVAGEDALLVMKDMIAVADGLGMYHVGTEVDFRGKTYAGNSRFFALHLLRQLSIASKKINKPLEMLKTAYKSTIIRFLNDLKIGASTAVITKLENNQLELVHIGDSECLVIRRGSIIHEATDTDARDVAFNTTAALCSHDFKMDLVNEIKTSQLSVEEGDIIVIGSDGVFDNLFKDEIVSLVKHLTPSSSSQEIFDAADRIGKQVHQVAQSKEKRTPWSVHAEAHKRMLTGGKKDDTSVIVAVVQKQNPSSL